MIERAILVRGEKKVSNGVVNWTEIEKKRAPSEEPDPELIPEAKRVKREEEGHNDEEVVVDEYVIEGT